MDQYLRLLTDSFAFLSPISLSKIDSPMNFQAIRLRIISQRLEGARSLHPLSFPYFEGLLKEYTLVLKYFEAPHSKYSIYLKYFEVLL